MLVMHRNKYGSEYFTLVGGRLGDDETTEQALVREVKEETGLDVTACRLVFVEEHAAPYNEQYIFLCNVAPHEAVAIQSGSEEGVMNRFQVNTHELFWVPIKAFADLPFRTPALHNAIIHALQKGFPQKEPIKL